MYCLSKCDILGRMVCHHHWTVALLTLTILGYTGPTVTTASNLRHKSNAMIDDSPYFRDTDKNITVHPGDRAILRCRVENLGTKSITWKKEGIMSPLTIGTYIFAADTRFNLDYNQRTREWSLMIQNVKPEDEGWYYCQVASKKGELIYQIKVNVLTVQITGADYVVVGDQLQLLCNATGKPDPPHNVDWLKNGIKMDSNADKGIIITKKIETKVLVSMLVIKRVTMSDGAIYTCKSSNNDAADFNVQVLNPVDGQKGKRDDKDKPGRSGQQNSAYKGTDTLKNTGPSLHSKYQYSLHAACISLTIVWFLDARWLS